MGSIGMLTYFIWKFNLENTWLQHTCVCLCVYIIRLKMLVSYIELLLWIFIKFRLRELCVCALCVCALCVR